MRSPPPLRDGIFLEMELHREARRIRLVYLETPKKRVPILTETFPSKESLNAALGNAKYFMEICARARALFPMIGSREENNLRLMKDLPFEPQDMGCDNCGSRPGEPCVRPENGCQEDRQRGLQCFLIWLAEQQPHQKTTKKLIIDVAEALGYNTAVNLYYRDHGVVLTSWATGTCWRLYVGGRLDPTKSVWMTRGANLTKPERGPFQTAKELALAIRLIGREEGGLR